MADQQKKQPARYQEFTFITYPDSMGNIYDQIEELGLQAIRSPLHDSDFNTDTGELKKPHYHNMIRYTSLKSIRQIEELCERLGIKHYEIPFNWKATLRYFCHLDVRENSGKTKYNISDVVTFGGFDYNYVLTSKDGRVSEHNALLKYCREKGGFSSFRAFVDSVLSEKPEYIDLIIDKAYFYNQYLGYNVRDQNK